VRGFKPCEIFNKKLNRRIAIIAVGGTAMTLLGLKPSTMDVDFCVESKNLKALKKVFTNDEFKIDFFQNGFIFSEQLPDDYMEKSNRIEAGLINLDLRALSAVDLIITKAARYNERDEEDIMTIIKTNKIRKQELEQRFKQVRKTFVGRTKDYEHHFKLVLRHL